MDLTRACWYTSRGGKLDERVAEVMAGRVRHAHWVPILLFVGVGIFITASCGGDNETASSANAAGQVSDGTDVVAGTEAMSDVGQAQTERFPLDPANDLIRWPDRAPTPGLATLPTTIAPTAPLARGQARAAVMSTGDTGFSSAESNCLVDDYRLENGRVLVCIQGRRSFSPLTENGGQIIDARRRTANHRDGIGQILVAPELGEVDIRHMGIVRDGRDGQEAIIRVEGYARGMRLLQGLVPNTFVPPEIMVITEYRLGPNDDHVQLLTWVVGDETYDLDFRLYDLLLFGGQSLLASWPSEGLTRNLTAAQDDHSAYAFESLDGTFDDYFLIRELIPAMAAEHRVVRIRGYDAHLYARRLIIGDRDIESVRQTSDGAGTLIVDGEEGTRILITDDAEAEVTRGLLDEDGQRAFKLQPGSYVVTTVGFSGGDVRRTVDVGITEQSIRLEQPRPASLTVRIIDEATGSPIAGRLNLVGVDQRLVNIVDEAVIELPAGEWTATLTHGWHFTVAQASWSLEAGQSVTWLAELSEVLPTPGWASGEFHQHASPSIDSERPVDELIRANMAEGIDFMVPSDHDVIYDYAQRVGQLGYEGRLGTPLTGVEVSPTYAHMGAYGLPYDPKKAAGGAPAFGVKEGQFWRTMEMPELVSWVRKNGARLVQLNHPRGSQSYFKHVNYEPNIDIDRLDPKLWTGDFDAIEIFNGQRDFCRVFQDWMGLLNQGVRLTAIGNSDTHRNGVVPGYPRNYIPTMASDSRRHSTDEVVTALKTGMVTIGGGHSWIFQTGPIQE